MKLSEMTELLEASGAPCLFVDSKNEIKFVSRQLKDQMLHAFVGMEGRSFYDAFDIPEGHSSLEDVIAATGPAVKLYLKQDSQIGVWRLSKVSDPDGYVVAGESHYMGVRPKSFEGIEDFVQYSKEGFLKTRLTGQILDANPRICEMFGYTKDELLKFNMQDLFGQPSLRQEMLSELRKKGYSKGKVFPYFKKDGSILYGEVSNILLTKGSETFITGYIVDVTERVMAEREIQKARDLIDTILTTTSEAVFVKDLEGHCLLANPALADLVGVPLAELLGGKSKLKLPFWNSWDEDDGEDIVIDKGGTITETEEIVFRDGRRRVMHLTRSPLRDKSGDIFAVFGVVRDITENHRLRLQLEESFERFKVFIEEIPFAVAMFDKDLNYVTSSNKWRKDFHGDLGLRGDIQDVHFFDIFPHFHDLFFTYIQTCLMGVNHGLDNDQYTDKDGNRHYLRWTMVPWSRDEQVMGFILMIENLDAAMEMEDALEKERAKSLQNSKMAALGEMATAIAHEINNPMAIIQTSNDLVRQCLLKETIPVETALTHIERVRNTVERISKIIKSLMNVSRDSYNESVQEVRVRDLLEDSTFMHRERFRLQLIDFKINIEEEWLERQLVCKPVQIAQILINLLSNAQDAVATAESKWIDLRGALSEGFFEFRVSDSGGGIESSLRDRVFDPFYTTKGFGRGTGLGLSISKELAAGQGCELFLDSGAEHTTFVLKVPLSQRPKP